MNDLPLVLDGPIFRHVELNLVTVCIALKEVRTVKLSVWDGRKNTGSGITVFNENEDKPDLAVQQIPFALVIIFIWLLSLFLQCSALVQVTILKRQYHL